jgi:hypothetical protein
MTKTQALAKIAELYRTFNAADSCDSVDREDWTKPEMAGTCCRPLDQLLSAMLTTEEFEEFIANL